MPTTIAPGPGSWTALVTWRQAFVEGISTAAAAFSRLFNVGKPGGGPGRG